MNRLIRTIGRHLRPKPRYTGVNLLDRTLTAFLADKGGFFVELGANDGISQSNTFYFEKYRGWTGILIEPIPELFEQCVRNRPNARHFNFACTDPDSAVNGFVEMTACNLMSVTKGAFSDPDKEAEWLAAGARLQNITATRRLQVPCTTLSRILTACGDPHIDFLSLDVEGYELPVLRGLDLSRHRPSYLLVEILVTSLDNLVNYLSPHYKVLERLGSNDVLFTLRSHPQS